MDVHGVVFAKGSRPWPVAKPQWRIPLIYRVFRDWAPPCVRDRRGLHRGQPRRCFEDAHGRDFAGPEYEQMELLGAFECAEVS